MNLLIDILIIFLIPVVAVALVLPVAIAIQKIQEKANIKRLIKNIEDWKNDNR